MPTRSAETYLVKAEGEQVLFLSPLRFQPGAALTLTRPVTDPDLPAARAIRGQRGLLVDCLDYRGVSVLSYVTPVAGTAWLMTAEIDREEVEAGIRTVAWVTGLVGLLGVLLVYAVGYLLWRRARHKQELAVTEQLHKLATTDALTGTWNRRHFEKCAAAAIARAQRYREPLCLILFDLDHFKGINDRSGHEAGDRVLVDVVRLLKAQLRETEVLARWGGEEFVILLPHCTEAEGLAAAERLRHLLEEHPLPCAERVTASFGVGELRAEEGFPDWLRRVDRAMYAAKATGRNAVCQAE